MSVTGRLAWVVPSRGRPHNVMQLLNCFAHVSTPDASHMHIWVDDDDPHFETYRTLDRQHADVDAVNFHYGPRERDRLGGTLNRAAGQLVDLYDAIGFMGDDHRPRTPRFDATMLASLDQLGTGMVYGDDLLMHDTMPTAIAMTSDIVRALGWFSPPGLVHLCIDVAWLDVGRGIERIWYLPDVVIEHVHPAVGKAPIDAGYEEANSPERVTEDHTRYFEWRANDLQSDVEKVRQACGLS